MEPASCFFKPIATVIGSNDHTIESVKAMNHLDKKEIDVVVVVFDNV